MLQILYPKQNGPPNVAKSNFSGWQICTLMNLLTVLMGWSLDGKAAIHKTALQLAYQYAQNMYKLWMALPPNSVMEITHSFARGPLKEITEVFSTSSGVHPCSSIQRQASSICTQNLPPASHSCPSWISTSHILPQAGLCPPQAHQPLWWHGPSQELTTGDSCISDGDATAQEKVESQRKQCTPTLLDTGTVLPRSLPYQEGKDYGDC